MIQIKKKEFYKIFKYLEICVRVVYYKKNISTAALLYIYTMYVGSSIHSPLRETLLCAFVSAAPKFWDMLDSTSYHHLIKHYSAGSQIKRDLK